MNVLFVDDNNQFRSRIAEILFKRYNSHPDFNCRSAGAFHPGYWFNLKLKKKVEKIGLKMIGRPRKLNQRLWIWADLIIVLGDDISVELTENDKENGKEIITWHIDNLEDYEDKHIKGKILDIGKKVKELCEVI